MKRFKFVVCKVLQREAYYCAARSKNIVDVVVVRQGLHITPDLMKQELSTILLEDHCPDWKKYDAILLGYGLCSNGTVGLSSKVPLVVPRAHDCITLLLGSKEKYREYFDTHSGTYWYSPGWIDTNTQPGRDRCETLHEEYRKKFGDDNAEYLMDIEKDWINEYSRAVYVDWGINDNEQYKSYTRDNAEYLGWEYEEMKGSSDLLQRLVDGEWDEKDFLVLEPGEKITADPGRDGIIKRGNG